MANNNSTDTLAEATAGTQTNVQTTVVPARSEGRRLMVFTQPAGQMTPVMSGVPQNEQLASHIMEVYRPIQGTDIIVGPPFIANKTVVMQDQSVAEMTIECNRTLRVLDELQRKFALSLVKSVSRSTAPAAGTPPYALVRSFTFEPAVDPVNPNVLLDRPYAVVAAVVQFTLTGNNPSDAARIRYILHTSNYGQIQNELTFEILPYNPASNEPTLATLIIFFHRDRKALNASYVQGNYNDTIITNQTNVIPIVGSIFENANTSGNIPNPFNAIRNTNLGRMTETMLAGDDVVMCNKIELIIENMNAFTQINVRPVVNGSLLYNDIGTSIGSTSVYVDGEVNLDIARSGITNTESIGTFIKNVKNFLS